MSIRVAQGESRHQRRTCTLPSRTSSSGRLPGKEFRAELASDYGSGSRERPSGENKPPYSLAPRRSRQGSYTRSGTGLCLATGRAHEGRGDAVNIRAVAPVAAPVAPSVRCSFASPISPPSTRPGRSLYVAWASHLHPFGSCGIWLHLAVAGNFPRIPDVTPGVGLVHDLRLHIMRPSALCTSGRSASRPDGRGMRSLSQFRGDSERERRVRLVRPTGLMVTADGPKRRLHAPARPRTSPRQQPCGVTTDDPMPIAFTDPLPFRLRPVAVLFHARARCLWAHDVAVGHLPVTPVTGGPTMVVGHRR